MFRQMNKSRKTHVGSVNPEPVKTNMAYTHL